MSAEIGVVFNSLNDRSWLARLREWTRQNDSFLRKIGATAAVTEYRSTDDALQWRAENPQERLVVTFGFKLNQLSPSQHIGKPGEPIIVSIPDADAQSTVRLPNSLITRASQDIRPLLRKSLIRMGLRRRLEIRPPRTPEELSGYFSLRYQVWKTVGFLRDENARTRQQWELDFWDRTALPICAIANDGKVVGCTRLIRSHGQEERYYVTKIEELLKGIDDPALSKLFKFPNAPQQPFDILWEFPQFRAHYKTLVREGTAIAEVGRVIVDPEHRGQSLSEVLVDAAVAAAGERQVARLYLACREELAALYSKCGFATMTDMKSSKFFNIQVPSIVMERQLRPAGAKS